MAGSWKRINFRPPWPEVGKELTFGHHSRKLEYLIFILKGNDCYDE